MMGEAMKLKCSTFILLAIICFVSNSSNIVEASRNRHMFQPQAGFNLTARLLPLQGELNGGEGGGGLVDCWNALTEIKSCSNEIIAFFVNGTTDIGPPCCKAIIVITNNCWPAMLATLGFTSDEGNILQGYCDASTSGAFSPAPSAL